jgi:hypothetical protein
MAGSLARILDPLAATALPALRLLALSEHSVRGIASSASSRAEHGRIPGIRFPPRRTPAGERISDLPIEKANAVTTQLLGGPAPAAAPGAAAAPAAPAAAPKSPAPQPVAGPKTTLVTGKVPPRRTLTAAEMEMIELGGAPP